MKWCFICSLFSPYPLIFFRLRWLLLQFLNSRLLLLYRFFFSIPFRFLLFFFGFRLFSITGITFTGINRLVCCHICCCCYPNISWWLFLRNWSCLRVGCDRWLIVRYCLSRCFRVPCSLSCRSLLITYCDGRCSSLGFLQLTVLLVFF